MTSFQSHHSETVQQQHFSSQQFSEVLDEFDATFRVDSFEHRLLRETDFRESLIQRHEEVLHEGEVFLPNQPVASPQIQQKQRNSKLHEGSQATFQAKVYGNPLPKIYWFKNGQKVVPSQNVKTSYSDFVATLHINVASPTDSGHYTMLADSSSGRVVSTAQLVIESRSPQTPSTGVAAPFAQRQQSQTQSEQVQVQHIQRQQSQLQQQQVQQQQSQIQQQQLIQQQQQQQQQRQLQLQQQQQQQQQLQQQQYALQQQAYMEQQQRYLQQQGLDVVSGAMYEKALSL